MRILLIYPGATWSPFDVATGYEAALRALGHEVFAFDFHTQYKFYLDYLGWLSVNRGMTFPSGAAQLLASERVAIEIIDHKPDVILAIMGIGLHRRAYVHAHVLGVPMAVLLTESPYADEFQAKVINQGDVALAFTNDRSSVADLGEVCEAPIVYVPHSYDPARHYPHKVNGEHGTDVFFYGTLWPERQALLDQLDLSAYNASVGLAQFGAGDKPAVIDNDDMVLWYSGTRIALNHHRTVKAGAEGHVTGAYSLGPRAFEIAACGAFQLCDDARPELREVFGDSVATYHGPDDMQIQIDYYLSHEAERCEMAAAALEAVQPCTFLNRAREIVVPALEGLV